MDDDLDALLDSALDTMNEQDTAIAKEKEAHEAAAQDLLSEAMKGVEGAGGATGGMDADMLKALGGLMAILQKGPEAMENASDEDMAAITSQLQATLEQLKGHPDLNSEDATKLIDMKNMMDELHALDKGQQEGSDGEPMSEEEFHARREELAKMLEAMGAPGGIMGGAGGGGPDLPPFPFPNMAAPTAAANATGVPLPPIPGATSTAEEEEACRRVFEMTLGLLQEKEIEQPFVKLRNAFGPWLAANRSKLPPNELARFENQYRVAGEMVEFFTVERVSEVLREGGATSTEDRARVLDRFGSLMAELHSFGEVPSDLFPEGNDALSS